MAENSFQIISTLNEIAGRKTDELFGEGHPAIILDLIKKEVNSIVIDPSTPAGRKEIISLAYQISRTKSFLDDTGKALTEDYRKFTARINDDRKLFREELDALRDAVRKPVTDMEEAEKALAEARKATMDEILTATDDVDNLTSEEIGKRVDYLDSLNIDHLGDLKGKAEIKKGIALTRLRAAKVSTEKAEEAAKAELDRIQKERDQKIADDARIKAEADSAKAIADAQQKQKEAEERAANAVKEAERKAEADAQAKRNKEAADAKAIADADAARAADEKHRITVKRAAAAAFEKYGFTGQQADNIIHLIIDGEIPAVSIKF